MIVVLRLGHRPGRDERVTTHVALTARALGAAKMVLPQRDPVLEGTVARVAQKFGGAFVVETGVPWKPFLKDWAGTSVHLTMYGETLETALPRLEKTEGPLLVVVGAEKVPRDVFDLVTLNVAVSNQPHSEVAALAVFLDRLRGRPPLTWPEGGTMRIVPSRRGKTVVHEGRGT
jgi:tRNA (cytidine56-2'-O)-methyltransferase